MSGTRVSVYMPQEQWRELYYVAERIDRSPSWIITKLVSLYLADLMRENTFRKKDA